MPRNALATHELRSYDPPWYDKAAYAVSDWLYGPNANASQTGYVKNALGPDNPFNLPAQATRGVNTMSEGYRQGDYGKMAGGAVETAASAIPMGYGFGRLSNAIYDRMPTNALGIFGGRLAKTADHAALAKAEEMTARGVPREQVWRDTGWFAGADGKWRFEIDDSGARFSSPATWDVVNAKRPMSDSFEHTNLFAAYPESVPTLGPTPLGSGMFNPANNEVLINGMLRRGAYSNKRHYDSTAAAQRGTTLHELQHFAQKEENFAHGGAPLSMSERDIRDYRRLAGEVEARTVQKRMDLTAEQRRARAPWLDYDVPEANQIILNALGD